MSSAYNIIQQPLNEEPSLLRSSKYKANRNGESTDPCRTPKLIYVYLLSVKFIKHNQNCYLKLDVSTSIRRLHQKKLVLSSSGSWHDGKTPCQESGRMRGPVDSYPHHGSWLSFRICMASLIHLVKRSGSLSITVTRDQLMTWFSWVAWSVRADLLCSVKLDARSECASCFRFHSSSLYG